VIKISTQLSYHRQVLIAEIFKISSIQRISNQRVINDDNDMLLMILNDMLSMIKKKLTDLSHTGIRPYNNNN